jgi:hypothetical protein
MPILSFQVDNVGQAGNVPQWNYFYTDDELSVVVTTGYLNGLAEQKVPLNQANMAMVVTTQGTYLFNIVYSSGNWSFTQYS